MAAGLVALAVIAAAVFLTTRDTKGGLSGVEPNHVGIIDPKTNEIVEEIQVGLRPGPVAAGGGAVWVGNLDEKTLTKIDAGGALPQAPFRSTGAPRAASTSAPDRSGSPTARSESSRRSTPSSVR